MRSLQVGLALLLLGGLNSARATGLIWTEGAGGIDCLRMMAEVARGPGAKSDIEMMYTPLHGRHLSEIEARIMHINYILPVIIDHAHEHARLDDLDREVLQKIRFTLGHENRMQNVRFLSATEYPEYFEHAGPHRLAATGNNVGDPIYINRDQIKDMSLDDMVALLIHEFAHHHGLKDDELRGLDQLGYRVASSLKTETQSLAKLGLEHFSYSALQMEMAGHPPAQSSAQAAGMSPAHQHDAGFGSHLIVSDGIRSHDVREIIRQYFESEGPVLSMSIAPEGWRVEQRPMASFRELGNTEETLALVLQARVTREVLRAAQSTYEIVLPITQTENGSFRFRENREFRPYVRQDVQQNDLPLLRWLWHDLGFGVVQATAVAEALSISHSPQDGYTTIKAMFDFKPGLIVQGQNDLMWVTEQSVGGEILRTRLPYGHPMSRIPRARDDQAYRPASRYFLREVSPGRYSMEIEFTHLDNLPGLELKLASMLLHSNQGTIAITPEVIPTLKVAGSRNNIVEVLSTPRTPKSVFIKSRQLADYQLRDDRYSTPLDLRIEVPDTFVVPGGGRQQVKVLFEDNEKSHVAWGMPFTNKDMFWLRTEPVIEKLNGKSYLNLNLELALYAFDDGVGAGIARPRLPESLNIKGFLIQTPDLRNIHIKHEMEIRFP